MNGNRWHELSIGAARNDHSTPLTYINTVRLPHACERHAWVELELCPVGEHQFAKQERDEHQYRECDHSCAAELRQAAYGKVGGVRLILIKVWGFGSLKCN